MIIEFVGIPGAGKSTLARRYIKEIIKKRNIVVKTNEDIRRNFSVVELISILFSPSCWLLTVHTIRLSLQYPHNTRKIRRCYNFVKLFVRLKRYLKSNQIIVLEEGVLQLITSIAHLESLIQHKALKALCIDFASIIHRTIYVDCQANCKVAVCRTTLRRSLVNRFCKLPEDVRLSAFMIKRTNIDKVFDEIKKLDVEVHVIKINTELNFDEVYNDLCSKIENITKEFLQ